MQGSLHNNQQKTSKFDVFTLSEADVAFLNNESPKEFDDTFSFEIHKEPNGTNQQTSFIADQKYSLEEESLFVPEPDNSADRAFSSISETRLYQPLPSYDPADINDVIKKIVISEPLLTDEDLLFLLKKEYTGNTAITRRTLKQALQRNRLEDGYKRLHAYMVGKSYE